MAEETIPDLQFIDNANQRTPCVLVLDGSGSMSGDPIEQLNNGLGVLESELKGDVAARSRVQLLVIRAGGDVSVLSDWTDADRFTAPRVSAGGSTPLGDAMALALDKIEAQKRLYDANGIPSTRPWVFLFSDGAPDPGWQPVAARCRDAESRKKAVIFAIGTEGADLVALGQFSTKPAKTLRGLSFKELFVWLSRSVSSASRAMPGQEVQLAATDSWSTAGT